MIQWVYERVRRAQGIDQVLVATDDERIERVVKGFGGQVQMTSPSLQSGTDRVAAVADLHPADIYINVQGDEPLMEPRAIEAGLELVRSGRFRMGTVMSPFRTREELHEVSVVKVLADRQSRAIYFSRFPIPYSRGEVPSRTENFVCRKHVGLYIYTREVLMEFRSLPQTALELGESLEQLRAVDAGIPIGITEVDFDSIGVDTIEDLEKVRQFLANVKAGG